MIFIPVYLQVVDGMSPTQSGLAMLPMVVGIFTTSIAAGQLMSRNGRYKIFPILGAAIVIVALRDAVAADRDARRTGSPACRCTSSAPVSASPCRC